MLVDIAQEVGGRDGRTLAFDREGDIAHCGLEHDEVGARRGVLRNGRGGEGEGERESGGESFEHGHIMTGAQGDGLRRHHTFEPLDESRTVGDQVGQSEPVEMGEKCVDGAV